MHPASKSVTTCAVLLAAPVFAASAPLFSDETARAFDGSPSWSQQLSFPSEEWLNRLDRFAGLDPWAFHGVSVADVNGDGADDIYVSQPGGLPNLLFINDKGGAVEMGGMLRVDLLDKSRASHFADLDNDGDADLAVATSSGVAIFENRWPEPFFGKHFWPSIRNVTGFVSADFNGDGFTDLLLVRGQTETVALEFPPTPDSLPVASNGPQPLFFRGGAGLVLDYWQDALPASLGSQFCTVAQAVDIDGDARPDLVLGNSCGATFFLRNSGNPAKGLFSPFPEGSGLAGGSGKRFIGFQDFTGDGVPDFSLSGWADPLLNASSGPTWLADWNLSRSFLKGFTQPASHQKTDGVWPKSSGTTNTWGGVVSDFNLDGVADIVLAEGGVTWSKPSGKAASTFSESLMRLAKETSANSSVAFPEDISQQLVAEVRSGSNWQSRAHPLSAYLGGGDRFETAPLPPLSGDGRSVAVLDWNGDARPDLVHLGRGAPQLSLLVNSVSQRPGLSLTLKSSRTSRGSAGARVSLNTAGGKNLEWVVSEGGNFLGQSTRDLTFGVEPASVTSVTVRWAWSDRAEVFKPSPTGSRWLLEEGKGQAVPRNRDDAPITKPPARTFLNQPQAGKFHGTGNEPLLPLVVQNLKGESFSINERFDRPTVLVLFATADKTALAYLKNLAEDDRRLRLAGARIIALCVDPVPGLAKEPMVPAEAAKFLSSMNLPFFTGLVDEAGWLPLRLAHEAPRVRIRPVELPSVWLLGATGATHLFYEGKPTADELIADVKAHLNSNGNRWKLSLPFPGRWMVPPETVAGPEMAAVLADRQNPLAAWRHVETHREFFGPSIPYARFLAELGVSLKNTGNYRESIACFRESLRIAPNTPSLMNNLAWVLLVAPDQSLREPAEALRLARLCNEAQSAPNTVFMDTLAVALAANDLIPEAIDQAVKALESAKRANDAENIREISRRLEFFRQGKSWPP